MIGAIGCVVRIKPTFLVDIILQLLHDVLQAPGISDYTFTRTFFT
jgi:hypothetical protein